ncbi:hypothetical protein [Halobacterium hubeiense]|uniref:hypothetical protein n=1 Tax=Halobacterium hubeiense TaxID=1407499 RepID=UPI00117AAE1D|nr:hypothetical protein [Halobacterium hubeiense]
MLDVVGALLLAIPDFGTDTQHWIRERLPWPAIRTDHNCSLALKDAEGATERDVTDEVLAAWPLPRRIVAPTPPKPGSNDFRKVIETTSIPVDSISMVTAANRTLEIVDCDGEVFEIGLENVYQPLEDRINRRFRSRGLVLLAAGFGMQLVGYLL